MHIYTIREGDDAATFMRNLLRDAVTLPDAAKEAFNHLLHLCDVAKAQYGYTVGLTPDIPHFDYLEKKVMIPAVRTPDDYLCALHEFGHAFGPRQTAHHSLCDRVMANQFPQSYAMGTPEHIEAARATANAELGAWEWTIANTKVHMGGAKAVQALASYVQEFHFAQDDALMDEFFVTLRILAELQ